MTPAAVFVILVCLVLAVLAAAAGLFLFTFSNPPGKRVDPHVIPQKELHAPVADRMLEGVRQMEMLPFKEVSIQSYDGHTLYGTYYDLYPDAPVEIFFHGYHGTAMWDGYGCFRYCQKHRHNLLLVEERAHGRSKCRITTFGIKERYDCRDWVGYVINHAGEEVRIILSGVSMGAAIVLMASDRNLPGNVKGIIADCGFTSPAAMIKTFLRQRHYSVKLVYPLLRLGARMFGGFDLEESSAVEAVRHTDIPVLLIHGDLDRTVPFAMCEELYEACASPKQKAAISGAGHAISAVVDFEAYEKAVTDFLEILEIA